MLSSNQQEVFMNPLIPCPFTYGDIPGGGVPAVIVVANTAPTVSQNQQQPGTFWLNPEPTGTGNLYFLAGFVLGVPQWELISSGSGSVVAVAGTTNQVTVNTVAGTSTVSLPTAITTPGSLTTTTSLTATLGNITATNGNLVFGTAGNKISAPAATTTAAGANSFGRVSLTAGSAVVATTAITATSIVLLTNQVLGTVAAPFPLGVTARTAGTSFTITSSDGTDTSTIGWVIIN
jgi:hypothetical protein